MKCFNHIAILRIILTPIALLYAGFIIYLLISFNLIAHDKAVIFKGQAVKFRKKSNGSELHGRISGKEVIASPNKKGLSNKNYLGAFRKLKRDPKKNGKGKLVTFYVFEK